MADTRVVLPACPCPMRARLRRLAPSYTFTGCLLPQAYGESDTDRNEDEYRVQASPTTPAKLLMLTQGVGRLKGRDGQKTVESRTMKIQRSILEFHGSIKRGLSRFRWCEFRLGDQFA